MNPSPFQRANVFDVDTAGGLVSCTLLTGPSVVVPYVGVPPSIGDNCWLVEVVPGAYMCIGAPGLQPSQIFSINGHAPANITATGAGAEVFTTAGTLMSAGQIDPNTRYSAWVVYVYELGSSANGRNANTRAEISYDGGSTWTAGPINVQVANALDAEQGAVQLGKINAQATGAIQIRMGLQDVSAAGNTTTALHIVGNGIVVPILN